MPDCFLSSQMNATGGFSAPLSGLRRDRASEMGGRLKQKCRLRGILSVTYIENLSAGLNRRSLSLTPTYPQLIHKAIVLTPPRNPLWFLALFGWRPEWISSGN
jgi:hypothetical protein